MYILKLKMGKHDEDHEHLCIAISEDIIKLQEIEKEWNKIKSSIHPDYPIDDLYIIVNDFFKKYEVLGNYEEWNGCQIELDRWLHQERSAVVASMTYISKVKQV